MKIDGFDYGFLNNKSVENERERLKVRSNYLDTIFKLSAMLVNNVIDFEDEDFCIVVESLIETCETKDHFIEQLKYVTPKHEYYKEVSKTIESGVDISDDILHTIDLFLKYDAISAESAKLTTILVNSQDLNYIQHYVDYCLDNEIQEAFASILITLFNNQKLTIPFLFELTKPLTNHDIYDIDPAFVEYLQEINDSPDDKWGILAIDIDVLLDEIELFLNEGKCDASLADDFRSIILSNFKSIVDLKQLADLLVDLLDENEDVVEMEVNKKLFTFINDVIDSIEEKFF